MRGSSQLVVTYFSSHVSHYHPYKPHLSSHWTGQLSKADSVAVSDVNRRGFNTRCMVFTRSLEKLGEWVQVELPRMTHRIPPSLPPPGTHQGSHDVCCSQKVAPHFLLQDRSASAVYLTSKMNAPYPAHRPLKSRH